VDVACVDLTSCEKCYRCIQGDNLKYVGEIFYEFVVMYRSKPNIAVDVALLLIIQNIPCFWSRSRLPGLSFRRSS